MIPFVSFRHSKADRQIDLMIDSGSQGNIIKMDVIPRIYKVNHVDKIRIQGISKESLITLGSVNLKIFDQTIKFYVIENEVEISYNGILGVDFLNKSKVTLDFVNKSLKFNGITMPFRQNGNLNETHNVKRIYSVEHCFQDRSLPLIDVVNRQKYYIGQFLLDTGSKGNLIKISFLPLYCDIDIKNRKQPNRM